VSILSGIRTKFIGVVCRADGVLSERYKLRAPPLPEIPLTTIAAVLWICSITWSGLASPPDQMQKQLDVIVEWLMSSRAIVREIQRSGIQSLRGIARVLAARGIPTGGVAGAAGGDVRAAVLTRMLSNTGSTSPGELEMMRSTLAVAAADRVLRSPGFVSGRRAIAVGYVMHGLWDLSHCLSGSSLAGLSITEIPLGYGIFCSTYDFVVACYLMISDTAWHDTRPNAKTTRRHR
jgi:hypothetical protein